MRNLAFIANVIVIYLPSKFPYTTYINRGVGTQKELYYVVLDYSWPCWRQTPIVNHGES